MQGDVQGQLGSRARSQSKPTAGPSETGTLGRTAAGPAAWGRSSMPQAQGKREEPAMAREGGSVCVHVCACACVHACARVCKCRRWTDAPPTAAPLVTGTLRPTQAFIVEFRQDIVQPTTPSLRMLGRLTISTGEGDRVSLTLRKKPFLALVHSELLSRLSVWSKSSMYTTVSIKRKRRV